MPIDQAALIQTVYDTIFSAYTRSPLPGMPTGSQGSEIFLTLEWPGQQLDASQYRNPWSPQNTQGSQMAIEEFSALVNRIPLLYATYTNSGITVEEVYQFILGAVATPVPGSESSPVATMLKNARNLYELSKLGSLAMPGLLYCPSYANPGNWYDEVAAQSWPRITINSQQIQTKPDSQFVKRGGLEQANAGVWKIPVKKIDVITTPPIIPPRGNIEVMIQAPLSPSLQINPDVLRVVSQQGQLQFLKSDQKPSLSPELSKIQQISPELIRHQRITPELTPLQRINPEILKKIDFVQIRDDTLDKETSNLEISFSYCRVAINRQWMMNSLLKLGGWSIPGQASGSLSTGSVDNNSGLFPIMPTAFIAVRNLQIKAAWGRKDKEIAAMCASSSQPIGFGPFALSGKYAESGNSYASSFDGVTLSAPGLQILGWINQITPYAPPKA